MPWKRAIRSVALAGIAITSIGASSPQIGKPAPAFQLTLIDGSKVTLDQLKGNVIVLNFWATWCVPCRAELPLLDAYYNLQRRTGLKVFAIATEDSLPIYQLKKLFAVMHITPIRRIKGPYDTLNAVPTNYIIDREGVVRYAKASALDLDDLNAQLVPLLKEPVPPGTTPS
ncbi:TlpA family protein disulfide reductase [Sphingomonas koreensis]|nr:TlpA family protein disulfide reductase [Sphingomonas koreensis]